MKYKLKCIRSHETILLITTSPLSNVIIADASWTTESGKIVIVRNKSKLKKLISSGNWKQVYS